MNILNATWLVAAFGVAGCAAQVPVAESYPVSYQKMDKASHHWDVLAADVAAQTQASLAKHDYLNGRPLYVAPSMEKTVFNQAFASLLASRLVNGGLPVSPNPAGAVAIRYETQVVKFNSERHYPGGETPMDGGSGHFVVRPSRTELIVTTFISEGDRFVMRRSDIHYLENVDSSLFVEQASRESQLKTWKVVGQ